MTDKERADVLRKAADIMSTEWDGELTDYMREYADGLESLMGGQVLVQIPRVSKWPEGCCHVRVILLYESITGRTLHETYEYIFDRDEIK